jgi:hypothetical protein
LKMETEKLLDYLGTPEIQKAQGKYLHTPKVKEQKMGIATRMQKFKIPTYIN